MNKAETIATWDLLQEFGFAPDPAVISDVRPGLGFDFGNFKLSASAVMGRTFTPVVLFTGCLTTSRTIAESVSTVQRRNYHERSRNQSRAY